MVMAFTYSVVWRTCVQPEYCGVGTEHWNYDFYWRPNAMFICLRRLHTSGGYNEEACFNCQCVRNEHGCVGSSPCGLLGHSLDERLLSGLEQFNSLEAIPQRLQKGARPVPNLWRSYGRQNASGRAPRMLVAEVQRVWRWVPY